MVSKKITMQSGGLLSGVLFVILLLGSLLICRYTNSFGAWLPFIVLAGISAIVVCVQLCLSKKFRINTADILLLSYGLYALVRMLLEKESYIEPLTTVKWLLLGLLYITGRLSDKRYIPLMLITLGLCGVLSYLFSFFYNPGHLGAYVSIGLSGVISLLFEKDSSRPKKVLLASLSILLFVILVLSKSRGALLALALALAYLWFSSDKYKLLKPDRKRMFILCLSVAVLAGVFILYRIRAGSADVRLLIWLSSGEAFLKAPLFGYSSGAVQSLYMPWQAEFFQTHKKCSNRGLVAASISFGTSSFFLYTYDIIPIIILAPLFLGLASSCGINDSCNEINKKQQPARLLFCAVVLTLTFVVCWNVGKRYSYAENDLKEFIHLPEDSMADRIRPSSESIIFRNKDMSLLYATHSFRLSAADHVSALEACSRRIKVVEMMSALGNLYLQQDGRWHLAERCFLEAHYMAPDRMAPKRDLFRYYRDIGDRQKAIDWAEIILSSSPRTYNAITIEIKREAREFMESIKK